MDEQAIQAVLGSGADTGALLDGWEASQATLPTGAIFFLEPSYVATAVQEAGLDLALADALAAVARRIAADLAARALAWHVYHRLFQAPDVQGSAVERWPIPGALLGHDAALLYPLALFGGLPDLRALYRAHIVPARVARDTLHDVQRWADHYRRHHGVWGVAPAYLPWLRLHLRGELYALGRLQFQLGPWTMPARAFRHRTSGAVVALSEEGVRYRADGQRDGAGGLYDPERAWTARLDMGAGWVVGHRITPTGHALRVETRLARAEWVEALAPGDPALRLHIPRGAPLEPEACRRSLEEALRFFPTHMPERPFVAFACDSWLLDAQLDELLPPSSNLVRFLRQLYLVPASGDGEAALDWAFDGVPTDLARAPRDTALRRALLDHLQQGGHMRAGGGFLLPADLPAWGTDIYRTA